MLVSFAAGGAKLAIAFIDSAIFKTDGRGSAGHHSCNGVHRSRRAPKQTAPGTSLLAPGAAGEKSGKGKGDQPMCRPPLTEKSAPVAKPDSSEATQDTMDAMSCGVPRRLTGMPATILSSTSWRIDLTMSVAM